jgi:hypothetical protein
MRHGLPAAGTLLMMALVLPAWAQDPVTATGWPPVLRQGETVTLTLQHAERPDNPFSPDDLSLNLEVVTPAGTPLCVPAFLFQDYSRELKDAREALSPQGEPRWLVRFTPRQSGRYRSRLTLQSKQTQWQGKWEERRAEQGRDDFIAIARDRRTFATGDGRPYFAIGENMCWPRQGGTFDYDQWIPPLADNGGNYLRLWINTFTVLAPEHLPAAPNQPVGLGRYDLANCWRVDYILKLAEQRGMKVLLCLDSFNSLRSKPMYPFWNRSPYNAANGGPIATPVEYFTNAEAKRYFRQLLRYEVARWSASPAVLAWEFWNEVDIIDEYRSAEVRAWHSEMATVLRQTDPHGHLITTSFAVFGDPAVQALPELDYTQLHAYRMRDLAEVVVSGQREKEPLGKPVVFGEIGLDTRGKLEQEDTQGVALHNSLWAGLLCGSAGTPMWWWWDSYIHPRNLYGVFRAPAAFAKLVDWRAGPQPAEAVVKLDHIAPEDYGEMTLASGQRTWDPRATFGPRTVELTPEATPPPDGYDGILHGMRNHAKRHNPQTFRATWPTDGTFAVEVERVSQFGGAHLQIKLDGKLVLDKDMPDQVRDAAGKITAYDVTAYNGLYQFDVPAGPHEIIVENIGNDWIYATYRLDGFRSPLLQLRVLALQTRRGVWLWAQNNEHIWPRLRQKLPVHPTPAVNATFAGLDNGRYTVRRVDPHTGAVGEGQPVTVRGGRLTLPLPPLTWDMAAYAVKQ